MQIASISHWTSIRAAVGACLFITYFIFYFSYYFAQLKQNQKPRVYLQISDFASKFYLFGIGCLLSLNYNQAGIFQVILAYLTMVSIIMNIIFIMIDTAVQNLRAGAKILFYLILTTWFIGIIIDYFRDQNSN